MLKHIISKTNKAAHKEQKNTQEETGPIVTPLEVTWGCLISSSGAIELFKESHVLGNKRPDRGDGEDVCEFIFIIHLFEIHYQQ